MALWALTACSRWGSGDAEIVEDLSSKSYYSIQLFSDVILVFEENTDAVSVNHIMACVGPGAGIWTQLGNTSPHWCKVMCFWLMVN